MLVWLATAALAADPTIVATPDGAIVGTAVIAAAPEAVRAALADPVASGKLSPDVLAVTATPSGACTLMDVQSRGAWSPLRMRSLRCPTATGWRDDLVSSDDVEAMHSEWRVLPGADGVSTVVEYRLDTRVSFVGVPDSLVQQGKIRSVETMLVRLVERVLR